MARAVLCCNCVLTTLCTAEQEIDGETLVMLHKCGSTEQLSSCGFTTIKSQMKFKKAVFALTEDSSETSKVLDSPKAIISPNKSSGRHKLTKLELSKISAEEQRLYLRM